MRRQPAQAFAKPLETIDGALLRSLIQQLVLAQAGAETHHFAQGIMEQQLAVLQPRQLQAKAIGTEIDCGDIRE